jgi:UPF0755 protein
VLRPFLQILKIATIAAVAALVLLGGRQAFDRAVARFTPADTGQPVSLTIAEGDTADAVADRLAQSGLLGNKLLFTTQLQITRAPFKPGTYQLRKGMSVPQIVDRVTGQQSDLAQEPAPGDDDANTGTTSLGGTAADQTFAITVPEGWRLEQIAEEYEKLGGEGGAEAFLAAAAAVDRSQYDFLADLPPGATLEGFLFPDTYTFSATDPALNVASMLQNFDAQITPEWRARADQMGLGLYDVLIFASLVEKEAQDPEERPVIADVYLDRFQEGWRLDADPAVRYAIGNRDGEWWSPLSGEDLETTDSPYNLYKVDGLPPSPICSPGAASIQAVLFPDDTPYMYFVAKNDGTGEHAFSETLEEQTANIERFYPDAGQ